MIDPKSLLPEVQKLLPGISPQEIMEGMQQFAQEQPDATNQQAIQALMTYLEQQKGAGQSASPQAPPFQNLISQLGAK